MLEAVSVSWSAAERYATDLVGCENILVQARPVGQQRACDGGLRLRVLRACRAVVSQQRVHLRRRRSRPAARPKWHRSSPRPARCRVVSQQGVHL